MDPKPPTPLIDDRVIEFVRAALGAEPRVSAVAGDASTRRFFRVEAAGRTAILMVHPEPLEASSPLYGNHRILLGIGAPVPRLIGHDDGAGLVLVEDLGDTTLQKHLAAERPAGSKIARGLYRQACDLIVLFHEKAGALLRPDDFAARHALDEERFLAEFDHFHRHYLLGLRRQRPAAVEETILRDVYRQLAETCGDLPRVYCHRDFQSRNLMVREGRLHLIDFQDARLGPYTYDAASLLRDSSLDLEEGLVEEMVVYLAGRLHHPPGEFRRDLDLMALQRNIKDLGTFAYQATQNGRRDYLDYVPRTLRSIRNALLRDRRFHPVFDLLERLLLQPL